MHNIETYKKVLLFISATFVGIKQQNIKRLRFQITDMYAKCVYFFFFVLFELQHRTYMCTLSIFSFCVSMTRSDANETLLYCSSFYTFFIFKFNISLMSLYTFFSFFLLMVYCWPFIANCSLFNDMKNRLMKLMRNLLQMFHMVRVEHCNG